MHETSICLLVWHVCSLFWAAHVDVPTQSIPTLMNLGGVKIYITDTIVDTWMQKV